MLSVIMHKDIGEYKPKLVLGLTARRLAAIGIAVGLSVIISFYATFVLGVDVDYIMFVIVLVCVPVWCVGFLSPKGMAFEKYFPLFVRHRFKQNQIFYVSTQKKHYEAIREQEARDRSKENKRKNHYSAFRKMRGMERWEPNNG